MDADTVSLIAAVVFLLIAIIGGGFTAKELAIPPVPIWGRLVSALLGIAFAFPVILHYGDSSTDAKKGAGGPSPNNSSSGTIVIYSDTQSDTSVDQIELKSFQALGPRNPPSVGDRITIKFTLDNVGERPFRLAYTFVAARDPTATNRDFGEGNYAIRFEPGNNLAVSRSILLDSAGTWEFWPCYIFKKGGRERYCPEEWKNFQLLVRS